ncbi:futalosine hydrolase [Chitinophaga agrisoli]|uniref:Futalosine hydrolase n=1 Tax=Chitinophaga agrisoli TaxID=2607653 RepID=A0A5B2VP20_9BACT|nr:futalosine hydrolase [Chitinophaga agrisoli]KAA2240544.1 futalosine hydrolase [Chitinophaga agrisoli]
MNLLVTAATALEIKPFQEYLAQSGPIPGVQIDILISGIGLMHTAWNLGRQLARQRPDVAIQAGIAGSFNHQWPLGQVVMVGREQLGDLGVDDAGTFRDLFEIGLWQQGQPPFAGTGLVNTFTGLPYVPELPVASSVSVQTVSGSAVSIERLQQYTPDVESMEGAAFHYGCLVEQVPFLQLRCISNYVEVRDKSKWNIPLAVKGLNEALIDVMKKMADNRR